MQKTTGIHNLTNSQRAWVLEEVLGHPGGEPDLLSSSSTNLEQTQVTSLCLGDEWLDFCLFVLVCFGVIFGASALSVN